MMEYEADRVRNAYWEKYARLQQIKATYDRTTSSTATPTSNPRRRHNQLGATMRDRQLFNQHT
jgi:hypothetical protein